MAALSPGTMTIEFSPQARRLLERTTKALEEMAKEQKRRRVANQVSRPSEDMIDVYRDAVSGNYVTKAYADSHPNTTVKEMVANETIGQKASVHPTVVADLDLEHMPWEEAVGVAMGYVSACWSTMEGAGTFESTRAGDALDQLIERLRKEIDK